MKGRIQMIKQPKGRNLTPGALEEEQRNIDLLNEALDNIDLTAREESSLVWLAGWEPEVVKDIIRSFQRAYAAKGK